MCGGAGGFLTGKAIEAGADVYVSADLRYNDFLDNNRSTLMVDIGHYESEHFTKEIFLEIIDELNPACAVEYAKNEINQIKFYI